MSTVTTYSEMAENELDGGLCFSLQREMDDVEIVARFTVEGDPVSKQRPRFSRSRGRVYTPGGTVAAEQAVAWSFRQQVGPHTPQSEASYGVYLGFFCATGQRRDVDNMTKLVLDALNGVAWVDDVQVSEISAKVRRWQPEPRTEVVVYKTTVQQHPQKDCEQCGKRFLVYPSAPDRKFCSNLCFYESRGGLGVKVCKQCGKEFQIKPSKADKMTNCSAACQQTAQQDALVHLTCGYCDGTFSLRPSEFKRRPNARFCSGACRNKARAKHATGGRQRPGFLRPDGQAEGAS